MLARHPYLGPSFEFMEREPGTAPFLSRLHNFTFGAMPSLGLTGAAIIGMKYGVPRLVNGLVRDLFREDAATYYRDLLAYAVPELESLESALAGLTVSAVKRSDPSENWSPKFQSARRERAASGSAVPPSRSDARLRNENLAAPH